MLKVLLYQRHLQSYSMFVRAYEKAARGLDKSLVGTYPSRATLYRWLAGRVQELPYSHHCAVLEAMLPGWSAEELFRPYQAPDETAGPVLLREVLRRHCLHTYREFCQAYDATAETIDRQLVGSYPAQQQFQRWLAGEAPGLPHPGQCTVLEAMFPSYTVRQLFAFPDLAGDAESSESGVAEHDARAQNAAVRDASLPPTAPGESDPGGEDHGLMAPAAGPGWCCPATLPRCCPAWNLWRPR